MRSFFIGKLSGLIDKIVLSVYFIWIGGRGLAIFTSGNQIKDWYENEMDDNFCNAAFPVAGNRNGRNASR